MMYGPSRTRRTPNVREWQRQTGDDRSNKGFAKEVEEANERKGKQGSPSARRVRGPLRNRSGRRGGVPCRSSLGQAISTLAISHPFLEKGGASVVENKRTRRKMARAESR